MKKPIILVKIGGSLITDKQKPFTLKEEALEKICSEIKLALGVNKSIIIGHGGGSFPHFPAKKYQTHLGVKDATSYRGIVEVADAAARLNRIVVEKLMEKQVNAISINPSSILLSNNKQLDSLCIESIEEIITHSLVPVVYGDVIIDRSIGCTIFSTERVLGAIGLALQSKGFVIERIIHCGQTNGVYDENGNTIPLITKDTIDRYRSALGGSGGIDVTGGMIHKVEESLALASRGIPGLIIDGVDKGSLSQAIFDKPVIGTRIE